MSQLPFRLRLWQGHRRGQSLVEFALVLPLLLVLLLGVADFGRVFQAGITIEAAARNGAEAAAQELVQRMRSDADPATPGLEPTDYEAIRAVAHRVACEEAAILANQIGSGSTCSMPVTAVCVHDGFDPGCGSPSATIPSECPSLTGWDPKIEQAAGTPPYPPYVEVRICYRFTTLINLTDLELPMASGISIGEIWLQKDRAFVAADY